MIVFQIGVVAWYLMIRRIMEKYAQTTIITNPPECTMYTMLYYTPKLLINTVTIIMYSDYRH